MHIMPCTKHTTREPVLLIKSSFSSSAEPEISNTFVPDTDRAYVDQGRKMHGWPTDKPNCEDNSLNIAS